MVMVLQILSFALAVWLSLYLMARDWQQHHLRYASLGLLAYAIVLAGDVLYPEANADTRETIARVTYPAVMLPALFWLLAILELVSTEDVPLLTILRRLRLSVIVLVTAAYTLSASTDVAFDFAENPPEPQIAAFLLPGVVVLVPLLVTVFMLVQARQGDQPPLPLSVMLLATVFFGMGLGILLMPLDLVPREWLVLAIGLDLFTFGYIVAVLDAFEQGENLRLEFIHAFDISAITSLVFGGQIVLVMNISTGVTLAMLALLLSTITAAIALQLYAPSFYRWVDRIAFADRPELQQERNTLRTEAGVLPRRNATLNVMGLSEEEFSRLTRRAVRDFGNLPKLASNPLTRLPIVDERLAAQSKPTNTLERAAELKAILTESIEALKPRDQGETGITDEWRFYNALYYPYVVGVRPYSRRADHDHLDKQDRIVLDWFRVQVPERTLYNWQKKAAQLIAQDLREKSVKMAQIIDVSEQMFYNL